MAFLTLANSLNDFLRDYGLYLALGVVALILIVALAILLPYFLKKGKGKKGKIASKGEYLSALGGEENVLSKELKGSRIVLRLADYSKVDKQKLLEAGVDGFIEMEDKLTLVLKGDSEKVYKAIFG
ncbi:MAG: hypothetical protein IAC61_05210 [Firmicutes bacterium]|uniref:PTS EIIB type-1 domain-containing protein n=1 Tax=Candidatus Alloenteromonas pullistercoris TaxID=2840785 RepID=A0A9D9GW20_9FIRM|nr:hypothetical protein [Candidatus Enteromonas pullistercoris]